MKNMFQTLKPQLEWGAWLAQSVKHLTSAQVHAVHEFETRVGLCAASLEPGAFSGFCVSLSFCPSPTLTLSLSKINKTLRKIFGRISTKFKSSPLSRV